MKVAFVNQPFDDLVPPNQNSIALWTYHVAPHIAQAHEVVVYGRRFGKQKSWDGQSNVCYKLLPRLVPNRFIERVPDFNNGNLPLYASRLYYLDYSLQVALRLQSEKADIIHIHNFSQFVPIIRAFNPNAKIVLHMNGEWLSQLNYDVMDQRLQQTDLALGSSDYITEKIRQRFPQHSARCHTVYNGVDVNVFVGRLDNEHLPETAEKRLLFVGRVSPEKGVHVLLEAFAIVAEQYPQSSLDIIGPIVTLPQEYIVSVSDDPEVTQLAALYERDYGDYLRQLVPNDLAKRVRFLGKIPQPKLVEYYQAADVLINPSFSESFGMSLVEAMACEKPVVATRVGGMQYIVDEETTGLLVNCGDASALAEAILKLLANRALRSRMGKAGRQRDLQLFSWDQVARRLGIRYEQLLNTP